MTYRIIDHPDTPRHHVEAEQHPDGRWRLVDWQGAVSWSSDADFRRFYEPVPGPVGT